jgi:hypothetical protein
VTDRQHDHHVRAYWLSRDWEGSITQNDDGFYEFTWIEVGPSDTEGLYVAPAT